MDIAAFFHKKKIDYQRLAAQEPTKWAEISSHFQLLGPVSFDQQYKFFFNDWRLRYPLPAATASGNPGG